MQKKFYSFPETKISKIVTKGLVFFLRLLYNAFYN